MVVFLSKYSGVGKESKKEYFRVTLAEVVDTNTVYQRDFFVDVTDELLIVKFKELVFGDVVEVKFEQQSELSNRMVIVDVKRKVRSPFFEYESGGKESK